MGSSAHHIPSALLCAGHGSQRALLTARGVGDGGQHRQYPVLQAGREGSERLSNLPKVTQPVQARAKIHTQVFGLRSKHCSL